MQRNRYLTVTSILSFTFSTTSRLYEPRQTPTPLRNSDRTLSDVEQKSRAKVDRPVSRQFGNRKNIIGVVQSNHWSMTIDVEAPWSLSNTTSDKAFSAEDSCTNAGSKVTIAWGSDLLQVRVTNSRNADERMVCSGPSYFSFDVTRAWSYFIYDWLYNATGTLLNWVRIIQALVICMNARQVALAYSAMSRATSWRKRKDCSQKCLPFCVASQTWSTAPSSCTVLLARYRFAYRVCVRDIFQVTMFAASLGTRCLSPGAFQYTPSIYYWNVLK